MPKAPGDKNLLKIQKLLDAMDEDGLTRAEFVRHFSIVIDLIKKLQLSNKETLDQALELLTGKFEKLKEEAEKKFNIDLNEIAKVVTDHCVGIIKDAKADVEQRLAELKNGKDGKDADEERVIEMAAVKAAELVKEEVKPLIPSATDIKNDIPVLGEQIRNALELLQGDNRLEMSAVKDLKETLESLEKRLLEEVKKKVVITSTGGGAQNGGRIVKSYDLSSQLNGVLKTFSLPTMWRVISVHLSSFPNIMRPTTDYTWTPTSITFTSEINAATSLASGQTLIIVYAE